MNKLNANENCMLGLGYPFFLNNSRLKDSYYYYEIYSPGLAEDLTPYLSLIKTGEKTISEPKEHGSDILAICIGSKKDIVNTGFRISGDRTSFLQLPTRLFATVFRGFLRRIVTIWKRVSKKAGNLCL